MRNAMEWTPAAMGGLEVFRATEAMASAAMTSVPAIAMREYDKRGFELIKERLDIINVNKN